MAKDPHALIKDFVKDTGKSIPVKSTKVCLAVAHAHMNMVNARKALTPTAQHYGDAVEALSDELRVTHQTIDNHAVAAEFREWLIAKDGDGIKSRKGTPKDTAELKKVIAENKVKIQKLTAKVIACDDLQLELMKERERSQKHFATANLLAEILKANGIDPFRAIKQNYEWNGTTYIDKRTGEFLSLTEDLGDVDEQ